MSNLYFGAFYTEGTPYEHIVDAYFASSCRNLNIEPIIIKVPNKGSWLKNVAEKPKAILDILTKHSIFGDRLVFLDADAEMVEYPHLFEQIPLEFELAYHTLNWNEWYGYKHELPIKELLTGTMFFRNTVQIRKLCQEWYDVAKNSNLWEQKVLYNILPKYNIKTYALPIEYCYMTSLPGGRKTLVNCKPVIKHYQKSRDYRKGPL